jgi:arylsulfatase A-like enzyme
MTARPNIVFLIDDQHRWDALGCAAAGLGPRERSWLMDGPPIQTPHLDRLAATGMRFSQAVCNVPVCVPSRYSFMTGLRGHQLGVLSNGHYIPDQLPTPTLGMALTEAGYRTAAFGKMHWKPAAAPAEHIPDRRGFTIRATNDGEQTDGPSELRFEDTATDAELAMRRDWANRFGRGGENRAGYVGEVATIPSSRFPESWLTDLAVDFLRDHADQDSAEPFCLVLSLDRPHPENVVPHDYAGLYNPADMALPPPVPQGFTEDDHYLRCLGDEYDWPRMTDDELRLSVSRYLANVTFVDACFGRVLDELSQLGMAEETMVVMTADHGDLLGERNRSHTKYCLYDAALRVPLIVRWPNLANPGTLSGAPVELVDLMPTWLDAAGLPVPAYLPGRSLRPLIEGASPLAARWRTGTLTEHYTPAAQIDQPRTQWAMRDNRYKLIERLSGPCALYDLASDPHEFENRIDDPQFAEVRERLRTEALREIMRTAELYPARNPDLTARIF